MKRLLSALGAVVLLLSLALGLFFYHQVPRQTQPFKEAEKADMVDLTLGAQSVHLVHSSTWTVQMGSQSLPADNEKVINALVGLSNVVVEDEISDRADRAAEFDLIPASALKVSVSQKGKKLAEGLFGKQAPDFAHTYFALAGKPDVYLARGFIRGGLEPVDPNGWRSHDILNLAEADIQSIQVVSAGKTYLLQRSSDSWTLNGKGIDPAPVYRLLGTLSHLRAEDFWNPSQPAPTVDRSTVTVSLKSGSVILHLGIMDPQTKRYPATADGVVGGFWIADSKANTILVKSSDFPPVKK